MALQKMLRVIEDFFMRFRAIQINVWRRANVITSFVRVEWSRRFEPVFGVIAYVRSLCDLMVV